MKLKFFIRTSTKKEKPREVPIYVRLRDDVVDLWQKTNVMVSPDLWDPKREDLKERRYREGHSTNPDDITFINSKVQLQNRLKELAG